MVTWGALTLLDCWVWGFWMLELGMFGTFVFKGLSQYFDFKKCGHLKLWMADLYGLAPLTGWPDFAGLA